jgi:hypothetical protein
VGNDIVSDPGVCAISDFIHDNLRLGARSCVDLTICRENGDVELPKFAVEGGIFCMQIGFVSVFCEVA